MNGDTVEDGMERGKEEKRRLERRLNCSIGEVEPIGGNPRF